MTKNMSRAELIEETIRRGMGQLSKDGALLVDTGKFTGRAANFRYIVDRPELKKTIDWGKVNKPAPEDFARTFAARLEKKVRGEKNYTYNGFVGAFPIEVISTSPWHILFATNMFREVCVPTFTKYGDFSKGIKVFHDPFGKLSDLGLSFESDTVILLDPVERYIYITGTAYAGEMKKAAFTLCNYLMPDYGIFPMHASANCLNDGKNSCVLFGLSGTGKTTLSASNDRALIGDDEIVWAPGGLTNLEGGCYAKLIDLKEEKEPEIFRASNRFGSILENVVFDPKLRAVDFCNASRTENTRGSYDIMSLDNIFKQNDEAAAPKNIIFLTADAFGAMPAVAKLNSWQAQYHFVAGYTAKVAGTELGVKEPTTAFSTCFGAPFMPRPSGVYAKLLADYSQKNNATVWLLNTGWTNGGYGQGPRFPLEVSRKLLSAIQNGILHEQSMKPHPVFGFMVPENCPGVDKEWLASPSAERAIPLAKKFIENAKQFQGKIDPQVLELGGPKL